MYILQCDLGHIILIKILLLIATHHLKHIIQKRNDWFLRPTTLDFG